MFCSRIIVYFIVFLLLLCITVLNVVNAEDKHRANDETCSASSCKESKDGKNDDKKSKVVEQKQNEDDSESRYRLKWNHNWDGRYPASAKAKQSNVTRTIIIIRHGQFRLLMNDNDAMKPTLTELGKKQAERTAKRLKKMNIPVSNVFYSSVISAAQTADIICKVIKCKNMEGSKGLAEGSPPVHPVPPVRHWKTSKQAMLADGLRMEGSFRQYFHRADPKQAYHSVDLLISHANAIRYMMCRALQIPTEAWLRFNLANCGITTLTIEPDGRVALMGFNDIGHMPPKLITFT